MLSPEGFLYMVTVMDKNPAEILQLLAEHGIQGAPLPRETVICGVLYDVWYEVCQPEPVQSLAAALSVRLHEATSRAQMSRSSAKLASSRKEESLNMLEKPSASAPPTVTTRRIVFSHDKAWGPGV